MIKYEPAPGTLAFRALAHMRAQDDKHAEVSNPALAATLNCISGDLIAALKRSMEEGLVFGRQKGGNLRSPFFWSLVDHSKEEVHAPPPGPQEPIAPTPRAALWPPALAPVPSPAYPPLPDLELDLDDTPTQRVTKVQPGDADPSIRELVKTVATENPLQAWASIRFNDGPIASDGIDIDEAHRTRDNVDKPDTRPPEASTEAAQVDGKDSREGHAEQRSRAGDADYFADGVVTFIRSRVALDGEGIVSVLSPSEPSIAEVAAEYFGDPAIVASDDDIRFGAWSNGELHIQRGAQVDVLSKRQFALLIAFLDSISLDGVREGDVA